MSDAVKRVAMLTRDLLNYDESLIITAKKATTAEEFSKAMIFVGCSVPSSPIGYSTQFNGENETMSYSSLDYTQITMSFWGDNAYQRAKEFSLMLKTEKSTELQEKYNISILNVNSISEVTEQIDGHDYHRFDINFNTYHDETISIETLRIDEAQLEFQQQ